MAEHGKLPSVMEMSYELPHHMGLQQQDDDKKVEHGTIPSTKAAIGVEHGDICTTISLTSTYEDGAHIGLILQVKLRDRT